MKLFEKFQKLFVKKETISDQYSPKQSKPVASHDMDEPLRYYFPKDDTDIAMLKTSVAGITHYMDISDARKPYQGHTVFEPENPYNKKAVKLVTDDGKMMGYVPESDLSLYYSVFNGRDGIRFYGAVGIFTNEKRKKTLFGKVMLVDVPNPDPGDSFFNLGQKQLDFMMSDFTSE